MIEKFILKFTNDKIEYEKIGKQFYYVPEQLKDIVHKEKPFSAGLYLGEEKGKNFLPSIALLDWLSKHSGKKIILNKKAAWLFICGRDVFGEGIVKGKASKNELVLIQNELDENLGYGILVEDILRAKKNKVVVKNLLDIGHFLRKERK